MNNKQALWKYLSSIKYTQMPYEEFDEALKSQDAVEHIYKFLVKGRHTKKTWNEFTNGLAGSPPVEVVDNTTDNNGVVLDPNDDTPEINQEPQELGKQDAATDSSSEDGSSESSISTELNRVANIRIPVNKEEEAQAAYKKEFEKVSPETPSMFDYQDQVDISNEIADLKKQQEQFSPISEDFAKLQEEISAKNQILAENNSDRTVQVMSEKRAIDQKYEALQKRNKESYKKLLNSVGAGKGVTEQIKKQEATFEKEKQDEYLSKFTEEQLEEFKAIDQIIKDTNSNTSVTLEGDRDILEDMGQGAGEAWGIVDKRNLQESEKIQLNSKVEAELLSSLNRRDREQAFKGHMPLAKKNTLVKQARMKVLGQEIKAYEKEITGKGEQLAIDLKGNRKQLELVKSLFDRAQADGDIEKADSYVDQFNALQASAKSMAAEGEALNAEYLEGIDELYGLHGYTVGKGMADAFRLIKLQETNRKANKGKGTNLVNAGFEAVINTGKNVVYGGIGTAMGMFGDLFTDSEGYSSYDAWNDMIEQSTNYDYAQVQGEDLLTADGGINTDLYAMGLNTLQMVPFTAELIRQVRTGQYGSLTKATGRILNRGKQSAVGFSGLSKELKNNIIMADATYRMTIVDNLKEAEHEGLTGVDAMVFANTKSLGTAVIQSVMPDDLLINGNAKNLFASLSGTLKSAAGKQSTIQTGKQFITNFAKEQLEENLDYGFGEFVNFSFGLAQDKELTDYLKGVKETAWGTTLLTGPMSAYGARKTKRQLNDMLISQFTTHGVESLEYLRVLGEKAKESGNLEELAQLEKAYNYGMDLIAMAKMDKKAVTIEQLELLNEKVKLEGRLSEATGKEAQDLQDNLDVIDNKIEAKADEVRKTRVNLDIVKAAKIAKQTGAFNVITSEETSATQETVDALEAAKTKFNEEQTDEAKAEVAALELKAKEEKRQQEEASIVQSLLEKGAFDTDGELFTEEALKKYVRESMGLSIDITGDQSAIAGVEAELAAASKKDKRTKVVKAEIAALKEKVKATRKATGNSSIVINRGAALESGYTTTAQHEVLHVVMKKALRSNPELAQLLGTALEQDLAVIAKSGGYVGNNFKSRKAQYRDEADERIDKVEQWASATIEATRKSFMSENTTTTEAEYERILDEVTQTKIDEVAAAENIYNEELLNLVSESLSRMEISDVLSMPKGKFGRVIDFFKEFALQAGLKKFDFQTKEGKLNVYGFIQRYNKEFNKGKLSRATKRLLDTGTNFTFTSTKEADEVTKKVDKVAGIRKSLNTRVPVAWTDSENKTESNKISVNGNTYSITMSDTTDMGGTKKDLAAQFYAYDANDNQHQQLVGSSKNSIRALAAIKNAIVDKALSMGAESVTFTGKEENARTSVYARMAQLTAKELGWGLDVIPISAIDENFELGSIDDLLAMNIASMEKVEYVEFKAFKLPNSASIRQSKMPSDLTMKIYNAKTDKSMDLYEFTDMAYNAYVEYGKQDEWLVDSIAEQWVNIINKGLKTGKFGNYGAWAEGVGPEAVRAFAEKVAYGKGSQTVAGLVGSYKPGTSVKIDAEAGGANEGKTVSLSGYINKYLKKHVNWWFKEEEVISETDKEAEEEIKYYEKQIAEARADGDLELMTSLQEDLEEVKKSSQSQLKSFATSSIDSDNNITQLADSDALEDFEFDSNTTDEQVVKAAPGTIEAMREDATMQRLRFNLYEEDLQTVAIAGIDNTLSALFAERGKHVTKDPFAKALKDYLKRNEEETGKLLKLIERYKADEFISEYMEYVINKAELTFFKASPLSRVKEGKLKSTGEWVQQTKVDGKYVYIHPTTKKVMGPKDPDWKREDAKSGDLGAGKYIKRRIKNAIHLPGFKAELLDYYYPKGLDAKPDKRKLRPLAMELAGELGTEMVMTQIQNPDSEIHAAMEEVLGNMSAEQESVVGEATAKDIATEARFQMLKDGIVNGLTEGLTNKIIESLERKGFNGVRQSKIGGAMENMPMPSLIGVPNFRQSKKHRKEYENRLGKLRTDLTKDEVASVVEDMFNWLDTTDVAAKDKKKYELAALHWTANAYLRFPEDGYKVLEGVRIANNKKEDLLKFKTPEDLFEKYADKIKKKRIDPATVSALSNPVDWGTGLVTYDVDPSNEGQLQMRALLDNHRGEDSNPWCLLARKKIQPFEYWSIESNLSAESREVEIAKALKEFPNYEMSRIVSEPQTTNSYAPYTIIDETGVEIENTYDMVKAEAESTLARDGGLAGYTIKHLPFGDQWLITFEYKEAKEDIELVLKKDAYFSEEELLENANRYWGGYQTGGEPGGGGLQAGFYKGKLTFFRDGKKRDWWDPQDKPSDSPMRTLVQGIKGGQTLTATNLMTMSDKLDILTATLKDQQTVNIYSGVNVHDGPSLEYGLPGFDIEISLGEYGIKEMSVDMRVSKDEGLGLFGSEETTWRFNEVTRSTFRIRQGGITHEIEGKVSKEMARNNHLEYAGFNEGDTVTISDTLNTDFSVQFGRFKRSLGYGYLNRKSNTEEYNLERSNIPHIIEQLEISLMEIVFELDGGTKPYDAMDSPDLMINGIDYGVWIDENVEDDMFDLPTGGVRQSKVTGQVGKTGFPWFDNPRIKYTNFLKAVGPDLAKKLQLGEIRNEEFEDLRAKVEDAHYDYLTQMAEADAWEEAQAEYLQIFKDRNFNDWDTFENDLVTQASLDSESMLSLQKGESDFGKGAKTKIKTAKKEGVMSYINDTLSRESVPQEAKEGLFGALIKQLLGATAAPLNQGMYLNTEGFFNEVVTPTVKKFKMNPSAFTLIQVSDGQSIALNGTKITSDLTKGVYSADVFNMVNELVSGESIINNSVDVATRIEEAEEAQQLFMFYTDWLADNFDKMNKVSVSMMMNSMFSKLRAIGPHMQPITKAVLTKQNVLLNDYTTVPTIPKDFIIAQALQYVYADKKQKLEKRKALEELIGSGETAVLPRFYADVIRQLSPRTPRVGFMSPEVRNKLVQMGMPALPITDLSTAEGIATVDLEDGVKIQDYKNNLGMLRQSKLAPTKSIDIQYAEDVLEGKVKMTPNTMLITQENPVEVIEELMDQGIAMTTDQLTQIDSEAKLLQGLASQGYNDITGVKFSKKPGIDGMLNLVNKNSTANKKQQKAAISLNKRINGILERKSGGKIKTERKVTLAEAAGKKGSKLNWFVSSTADDFQGLLYRLIPSAKKGGNEDWAWMKKVLVDPYAKGVTTLDDTNVLIGAKYTQLQKKHKDVFKKLGDSLQNTVLTVDQAVRAATFMRDPDNAAQVREDVGDDAMVRVLAAINRDPELKALVEDLVNILNVNQQGGTTIAMGETWFNKSIATEFMSLVSTAHRKAHLAKWSDNVDLVFNEPTLNKLKLMYGEEYVIALKGAIRRMKLGTKGISDVHNADRSSRQVIDWMSNAILPIMFLNTKSGLLQLISLVNFINTSDNNVLKFTAAIVGNPNQFVKDFMMIMNSNKLKQRRSGLRMSIEEAEIANIRSGDGRTWATLQYYARMVGFAPTKYGDSIAISFGGATFYRNRVNSLIKGGMEEKEAEKRAWLDFSEISDQAQQSSDQMFISQEQASTLGRVIMAFANTPSQYARMVKKAGLDLVNRRGSAVNNITKIAWYGGIQNAIFAMFQNAAFSLMFSDDDEWLLTDAQRTKMENAIEDEKDPIKKKKMKEALEAMKRTSRDNQGRKNMVVNSVVNSLLRGLGYRGAAIATVKDALLEYATQLKRAERGDGQMNDWKVAQKIIGVSPVLGAKMGDIIKIIQMERYRKDQIEHFGYSIHNPRYYEAALAIRVLTNNPMLEFTLRKIDYARQYLNNEEQNLSDAARLIAGYSPYAIQLEDDQLDMIELMGDMKRDIEAKEKAEDKATRQALVEALRISKLTPAERKAEIAKEKAKRKAAAKKGAATRKRNEEAAKKAAWEKRMNL